MVPRALNVSSAPSARPRRLIGYSSTIIVTPMAYSAPRKIREPNWKNANDQISHENAVSAVKIVYPTTDHSSSGRRPRRSDSLVTKKATNSPSSIGMRVMPSTASLTWKVFWMFGSSRARIELS